MPAPNLPNIPHHLPIDLDSFGFVLREKDINGNTVKNRCGRDFLYYSLNFLFPQEFSPVAQYPKLIEEKNIFGYRLPSYLIWTGLSFKKVPRLLSNHNLEIRINSVLINSYFDFAYSLFSSKKYSFADAITTIKSRVDAGKIVGIDMAVNLSGLADHVMFVYGYDDENLYVFDTHQAHGITYSKVTAPNDQRFIMKLPFSIIEEKWKMYWNRIWEINPR